MLERQHTTRVIPLTSVWPSRRDLADTLFRRVAFLALGWLVLTALTGFYLLRPRPFESEMILALKRDRAETLITTQATPNALPYGLGMENLLAAELELLGSRDLHQEVILSRGLDASAPGKTPQERLEAAVAKFRADLQVLPLLKANMIRIRYAASDPATAAAVLQELSRAYMENHLRLHGRDGAPFFAGQAGDYAARLSKEQATLTAFQQKHNIVLLGQQKDLNLRRLLDAEAALRQAELAEAEQHQRIADLETTLAGLDRRIPTQVRRIPNQYSTERLNTMLVELENRRTELLEKFRPEDRLIRQIDTQIASTRKALEASQAGHGTEEASDANPLRLSFEADLIRARTDRSAAAARSRTLREQIAAHRAGLDKLEAVTGEHDRLARNVRELENNYLLYSKKAEESRLERALDRQKFANVAVAQAPAIPASRKPRPYLAGLGAYAFGLAALTMFATVTGKPRRYVYTPAALERLTGVPVLATLPEGGK